VRFPALLCFGATSQIAFVTDMGVGMRRAFGFGLCVSVVACVGALSAPVWTHATVTRGHSYARNPDSDFQPVVITGGFEYRTTTKVQFWESDAYEELTGSAPERR
jgi:hypothetical protein